MDLRLAVAMSSAIDPGLTRRLAAGLVVTYYLVVYFVMTDSICTVSSVGVAVVDQAACAALMS